MVVAYLNGQRVKTIDGDFRQGLAELAHLRAEVELREENGTPLGRFTPPGAEEPICPWDPTLTREELDRRVRESPRMPLDEFLRQKGMQ